MSMKGEMARSHAGMRYVICAAIIGAVVCIAQSASLAQGTLSAGNVSAAAGGTALVPITLTLPTEVTGATMQFNLTVVPGTDSPPAIDTQVTFAASVTCTPDACPPNQNIANGLNSRLVGWFSNFSPLLTGTTVMGNLSVPIPAGAAAASTYTVKVLNPSGTSDVDNTIDLIPTPANGTITVTGGGPTSTPTQVVAATSTPTQVVVAPTSTPTQVVVAPTSTPTTKPAATATATKAGGTATPAAACPTCEDDDGCQIGARGHSGAWLLLIPAIGLLVVRRRR